MAHQTRSRFLTFLGASVAMPLIATRPRMMRNDGEHAFLAKPQDDDTEAHLWHGYPDECYALTTFADSLVALASGHGWYAQPPMVDLPNTIVVDFASRSEDEAEASLARGWNGAWEFPMGVVNTVASRAETNAQNARIERQLTLIGTAMRQAEFHEDVIEKLLDARSHPNCEACVRNPDRTLHDVFAILALGTDQQGVQLFSKWSPSKKLRKLLDSRGVTLYHCPLTEIPREDLEANRFYHIWDGTSRQAEEFRRIVWAPAWRRTEHRV